MATQLLHAADRLRQRLMGTITRLRQRIGVRLLRRTTRTVGLTKPGACLLGRLGPTLACVLEATVQREFQNKRLVRVIDGFCTPFPGALPVPSEPDARAA